MIDYLKISSSKFDHDNLINNPLLDFVSDVNTDTGEIKLNDYGNFKKKAKYKNLQFTIYINNTQKYHLLITGSLHKYFNNGEHNYNDFRYQDLIFVLNDLQQKFALELNYCVLHNLEFGVNIIPPSTSRTILKGLLSHTNKPFKRDATSNSDYYQMEHTNYLIKAYDKAKQYRNQFKIDGEILRIEYKYTKMEYIIKLLNKYGQINKNFITLHDLKNIEVLNCFGERLLKIWNEVLFYDYTISKKDLSNHNKNKILQWQNINFWEDLKYRQQKAKQRSKLYNVIKNYSQQLQFQISNLIQSKLDILLQKGLHINQYNGAEKGDVLTECENGKGGRIDSILNQSIGNPNEIKIESKKIEVFIPEYEQWINQPGDLPF